jgi:DnaJ-class molecular chaperone
MQHMEVVTCGACKGSGMNLDGSKCSVCKGTGSTGEPWIFLLTCFLRIVGYAR